MRDVHWCVTVDCQQIEHGNIANQIRGFTIDYGKFILIPIIPQAACVSAFYGDKRMEAGSEADNTCGSTIIFFTVLYS